jgi:hypothetical protein
MTETFFQKWFEEVSDNIGAFKGVRGLDSLIDDLRAIDAHYHDGRGRMQSVMQ